MDSFKWSFPVSFLLVASTTTTCASAAATLAQFKADFRSHRLSAPHRTPHLSVSIQCPSTSFWTGCRLMGQLTCRPYSRLVGNSFCVLQQGILSRWDVFHHFVLLAEQLSPCFIDRTRMARLVVKDDCVALQNVEV